MGTSGREIAGVIIVGLSTLVGVSAYVGYRVNKHNEMAVRETVQNALLRTEDINKDGLPDIISEYEFNGEKIKQVFYNTGNGRYQTVEQIEAEAGADTIKSIRDKYSEKPVQPVQEERR